MAAKEIDQKHAEVVHEVIEFCVERGFWFDLVGDLIDRRGRTPREIADAFNSLAEAALLGTTYDEDECQ